MIELKHIIATRWHFGELTENQIRLTYKVRAHVVEAVRIAHGKGIGRIFEESKKLAFIQMHMHSIKGLLEGYCLGFDENTFIDMTREYDKLAEQIEKLLYMIWDRRNRT